MPKIISSGQITLPKVGSLQQPLDHQVEYEKDAIANFAILMKNVGLRGTTVTSYDILWIIPGYGADIARGGNNLLVDGVACDLHTTSYLFNNSSPSTIYLRLQRPMGFKADPAAVGMWEPAVHGKDNVIVPIGPHTSRKLTFRNNSTSFMCPRQLVKAGRPCVHLATFSLFRDQLTDFGTNPGKDPLEHEVAVEVTVQTTFRANDGGVGDFETYHIVSFAGDSRMNEINSGPSSSVRVSDLRAPKGVVEAVRYTPQYTDVSKKTFVGLNFLTGIEMNSGIVDGLDIDTIYQLPYGINLTPSNGTKVRLCRFIKWVGTDVNYPMANWLVGDIVPSDDWSSYKFVAGTVESAESFGNDIGLFAHEVLVPATKTLDFKLRRRVGKIGKCLAASQKPCRAYHQLSDEEDGVLDSVLTALVVITKIVKVGVELAGMVGLLVISPPNPGLHHVTVLGAGGSGEGRRM
uniref:Uncharacterized protein n=1 Tax=Kwi virus TaxID=2081616 RepID=A0A2L1CDB6_9VIRU|nr:hypothetical protein [Kwi virus]